MDTMFVIPVVCDHLSNSAMGNYFYARFSETNESIEYSSYVWKIQQHFLQSYIFADGRTDK
jgi:hypothetical protein